MLKRVKAICTKHQKVHFVNEDQGRSVSKPQKTRKIIENQFKEQFDESCISSLDKFTNTPRKLNKRITNE